MAPLGRSGEDGDLTVCQAYILGNSVPQRRTFTGKCGTLSVGVGTQARKVVNLGCLEVISYLGVHCY